MTEILNHTSNNNALADPITQAGMHANTSLANDSQPNPTQDILAPQNPIVVPGSTNTDESAPHQVDPDNVGTDADDPVAPAPRPDTDDPAAPDAAANAAPPVQIALPTFADLLDAINQCKGDYRKIHTKLFVALYSAWLTFKNALKDEQAANQKALDDKCAALGIEATTNYLKLAKIAFGTNPQRASAKARVIKILESLGIKPDECSQWLEDNGGFEAVRTGYNADGTKKADDPQPKSPPASKAKANDDAPYITKAKAALATSVTQTIPAGLIDPIDQDAECTLIVRQQADGSFAVVAVLSDAAVVNAVYAAHGRSM